MYAWFVNRPLPVNLIMVVVFLLGAMTIADMRYEYNPRVDMGVVNITTARAGAGPEEIELSITLPLEEELLEVEGIRKLYSNSMENLSVITILLDLDAAAKQDIMRDIQRAVDRAVARLPADLLEKPLLDELSTLTTPIMDVHVTGDVPEALLRQVARNVGDGLREVEGIASVTRIGYRRPEVKIMLASEKLARLGISHEEIVAAIRSRNLRDSGGAVDSFTTEKKVVAVGQFRQPRDVQEVIIRAAAPGNAVRVRDVAEVVFDYEDWDLQSRVDGGMSIILRARKKALSDELHTAAAVREYVDAQSLPAGVELKMVGDISRLTGNMLDVLSGNAMLGLTSVFLLLCYFLQVRFALWVAIGIPFSICLTFLVMDALSFSINAQTLAGVILMMGIVVDDAVVVSENTQRLRAEGLPLNEASILGAGQVVQPVFFSALTTVLAFAPLLGMSGAAGEFMVPFVVAVIVILLASLLESLFLLPCHLAHVPRRQQVPERRLFDRLRAAYKRRIEYLLFRPYLTLLGFLVMFSLVMVFGVARIQLTLFPDIDIDIVHVKVELATGSSFFETLSVVEQLEQELREFVDPRDLLAITSEVGHHDTDFYGATEGRNESWAVIALQLQPMGYRPAETRTRELTMALQEWAEKRPGVESLVVRAQTDIPVTGTPVQVEVISSNSARYQVADELLAWLRGHRAVTGSWTSYTPGKDVIDLQFNHGLLAARGLSVEQVIRAIRVAVDGLLVDELQTLDERVRYRLQIDLARAGKLETLENLAIINNAGDPIFLSAVADFALRPGEANIRHYFGKRTVTVYGEIDESRIGTAEINAELQRFIDAQDWQQRFPQVRVRPGGQFEEQEIIMGDLGRAMLVCIIAIFAALVILFNSLSQPLLVLLCLPFGLIGVVLGYGLQGLAMGTMAMMGIIGLMGVLVNDSLLLLHTLNQRRQKMNRALSAREVAAVADQRFRPIFITSLTTAVAMLPTAYGILGENSYVKPVFMSMAWGVMFGGLVSLVLLPVLYVLDQDLRRRFRRLSRV